MTKVGRRVRFTADFDYKPAQSTTIAYKAGMTAFVRLECAEQAVKAGKAEPVEDLPAPPASITGKKPRRKKSDG